MDCHTSLRKGKYARKARAVMANALAVLFGFAVAAIGLTFIELGFRVNAYFFKPLITERKFSVNPPLLEYDPLLGIRPKASVTSRERVTLLGQQIYDVEYGTDYLHRRITQVTCEKQRQFNAIFFGCSYTFGTGVQQDETLPAQFGVYAQDFIPLNYAASGWGPQHMWVLLQNDHLIETFSRQAGIVLYVFIDDHLNRIMGNRTDASPRNLDLPHLEIENEQLVFKGLYGENSPLPLQVQRYIMRFDMAKYFIRQFTAHALSSEEKARAEKMVVKVVEECAIRLRHACPQMRFGFLLYPGSAEGPALLPWLQAMGIECFDYSGLFLNGGISADQLLMYDGFNGHLAHPNPRLNKLLAQQLAYDVYRRFPEYSTDLGHPTAPPQLDPEFGISKK